MKIILEGERPAGWNKMAKLHWSKYAAEVQRVAYVVYAQLDDVEPFLSKVDIHIDGFFKMKPLDSDNICDKFYIDALKGRVIKDDNINYVRFTTTGSFIDKERPRVEIQITECSYEL